MAIFHSFVKKYHGVCPTSRNAPTRESTQHLGSQAITSNTFHRTLEWRLIWNSTKSISPDGWWSYIYNYIYICIYPMMSHDVPFCPTKTLRLYPNVYWLNPHLSRISVTVHSNVKPDFVDMSMKPPWNHEIVYANSQSWWFKTKFNGQTPFLQYNTI